MSLLRGLKRKTLNSFVGHKAKRKDEMMVPVPRYGMVCKVSDFTVMDDGRIKFACHTNEKELISKGFTLEELQKEVGKILFQRMEEMSDEEQ